MKSTVLSEKKLHKIGRIDQVIRDHFATSPDKEIMAKKLMPLFIKKGIFLRDPKNGLYIRNILRDLDAAGKLSLLKHAKVVRKDKNRGWFFIKK